MKFSDLPSADRRRVRSGAATPHRRHAIPAGGDAKAQTPSTAPGGLPHWRCADCDATFTTWAAAERHADLARHHRIEWTGRPLPAPTGGQP